MDLGLPSTTLPVAPIKHEMAAAYRLQRAVRRQQARDHGRRIRAIWPHINELRAKYVDNDVIIQAGRASEFYSDEAIVARESLRSHPAVLAALHEAWVACSSVNQSGGLQQGDGLDKNNFRSMARRVYLVSVLASAREPEVLTCNRALERDWKADVGGRSTLSREAFYESWFQLADLHTRSISPSAYATWIRNVTGRIVEEQGEEQQRAVRWRDCDKIILQQTGGVRRSRSCSTATRPVTRSSMDDVTVRRRVKSEGSSSATATPRDGWRLQHWLSAFKAEAEREVARGVAAPPAAAAPPPPLTRKRRLSSSTAARLLAPIQQRSQPTRPTPPAEPRAAATVSTAATALPPRRNSLAPLPSTQAAAPAKPPAQPPDATPLAPRTPTPPQSATGGAAALCSPLKQRRRSKLRSPATKQPSQSQPSQPSKPLSPSSPLLPRPPKLLSRESSGARAAIAKARVARRWRAAVGAVSSCNRLLRSSRTSSRPSFRSAGSGVSDCDRAEFTGVN